MLFSAVIQPESKNYEDSVKINLSQAEKIFLQNNLQLLAAKYNIDATKASIIQAELWSNPNISIGQNIYNKKTGKYFDITKTGNTDLQIQQLFLLAGKRDDQIKLAQINTTISEDTFYDLLRSLKYELRTDFYDLYFLQKLLIFYDETIPSVSRTVNASEKIYENHAILLSEVLRLKSLLLTLETERLDILNRISESEIDLNVLLADSASWKSYYIPQLDLQAFDSLNLNNLQVNDLVEEAYNNRPDIKIAASDVKYEEINLKLQKALAIPDITLGGSYSRAGSYVPDYTALTLSIDLPIFNRNQGNIKVSEYTLESDKANLNQTKQSIKKEIINAFDQAFETNRLYQNFDKNFVNEYKNLTSGMITNYANRNMTIIEFTDFYESYRSSVIQMTQLQNSRIDAFEKLNFVSGKDVLIPKF
jgi:cobalt-zinc-cadmium efflux system outer membrane protein